MCVILAKVAHCSIPMDIDLLRMPHLFKLKQAKLPWFLQLALNSVIILWLLSSYIIPKFSTPDNCYLWPRHTLLNHIQPRELQGQWTAACSPALGRGNFLESPSEGLHSTETIRPALLNFFLLSSVRVLQTVPVQDRMPWYHALPSPSPLYVRALVRHSADKKKGGKMKLPSAAFTGDTVAWKNNSFDNSLRRWWALQLIQATAQNAFNSTQIKQGVIPLLQIQSFFNSVQGTSLIPSQFPFRTIGAWIYKLSEAFGSWSLLNRNT